MKISSQHISIGLLKQDAAWSLLLDQIGVHWRVLGSSAVVSVAEFSAVICNGVMTETERAALTHYAEAGGAVIYTTTAGSIVAERAAQQKYVTSLPPVVRTDHRCSEVIDLHSRVCFFKNGSCLESESIGAGIHSFFGIDIPTVVTRSESKRKSFYAERERLPHEIVARRSRNAVRQIVHSHLEYLHHQRSLPFVHKWFYPAGQPTIFTFRIDSDKGTQEQIEEIFQLSERYNIPTTWFLDVKSHEPWLEYFKKFTRQEIGVHCYEHAVYNSALLNHENFQKARQLIRQHGMTPAGMAAPTGAWTDKIGTAVQESGFSYSSEFAYDYDNLPSFPLIGSTVSPVVQLPIHPACIGIMRREQMTQEEMVRYFIAVIDKKFAQREPICLYHHPTHGMNGVFEEVFQYINRKTIAKLSYAEYAAWWKQRQQCSVMAKHDGNGLACESENPAADVFIRIAFPDGNEAIVPIQNTIRNNELKLQPNRSSYIPPDDIMRSRQAKFRHYLQNALDWWIKTTE